MGIFTRDDSLRGSRWQRATATAKSSRIKLLSWDRKSSEESRRILKPLSWPASAAPTAWRYKVINLLHQGHTSPAVPSAGEQVFQTCVYGGGRSRSNHHSSENVLGLWHFWFGVFRLRYSLGTIAVERVMGIMKIEEVLNVPYGQT